MLAAVSALGQSPADRGPLNQFAPSWLTLGFEDRLRYESHMAVGLNPEADDGFLVQRLHLRAGIEASSKVRFFVEGQDSRSGGVNPLVPRGNLRGRLDLRQGYVQIGDAKEWGWDLTVGRQELIIGSEKLIGVNRWANLPRTWDMARLGLQRGRDRIEVFASSVVRVDPTKFDEVSPGENVHGVHGDIRSLIPRHLLQPVLLWRTRPRVTDERGVVADSDIWTYGFRLVDDLDLSWEYEAELQGQIGDFGGDELRAWRAVGLLGHVWRERRWKPRLFAEYTFSSGDAERGDGRIGRFDTLPARAHRVWGITDQVGGRNAKILQTGLHVRPDEGWLLKLDHYAYWLATPNDNLYRHNGARYLVLPSSNTATFIGNELGVQVTHSWNEYLTVGGGLARLFSGPVIDRNSPGGSPVLGFVYMQFSM